MKYGLFRVILVDSYMESVVCAAHVDGHLNVQGVNGAGKTSLLRVLPVFYGEKPAVMLRADSGSDTKSFADYYLPREGSYVIFEYLGDGQPKMVVMYGVSQGGVDLAASLFVDSGYQTELFFDREAGLGKPSSELKMRLSAAGVSYYQPANRSEYRRILLDGQPRKHARYAMVPPNCQMSKLTPLFSGMFWRKAGFDDLKQIIAEWALPRQNSTQPLALDIQRKGAERWIRDYRAYQALEELSGRVGDLQQRVQAVHDHTRTLATVKEAVGTRKQNLQSESAELSKEGELLASEHQDWLERCDKELKSWNTTISQHQDLLDKKELAIKLLNQEHQDYLHQDMSTWQTRLTRLPTLRQHIREAASFLNTTESQSEQLTGEINRSLATLAESTQAERAQLVQRKEAIGVEYERNADEARDRMGKATESLQKQLSALRDDQHAQLREVQLSAARAQDRAENPQPGTTEIEALKQTEHRLQELHNRRGEVLEGLNRLNPIIRKGEREREQLLTRHSNVKTARDALKQDRDKLFALRDGGTGTLIHFLREQVPEWEASIGKVIDPDLLLNRNLSPGTAYGDSLYGMAVDLDALPAADFSAERLSSQIQEVEQSIQQRNNEVTELDSQLKELNAHINELEEQGRQLTLDRDRLGAEAESQDEEIQQRQVAVDTSIQRARDSAVAEAKRLEAEIESLEAAQAKDRRALSSKIDEANLELEADLERLKAARDQDRQVVASSIAALETETEKKRSTLQQDKANLLADKGLSPERIQEVQEEHERLTEELGTLEQMERLIKQFERFKENELPKLHQLEHEREQLSLQLEEARRTRSILQHERETRVRTLNDQHARLEHRLSEIEKEIRLLEEAGSIDDIETDRQPREEDIPHLVKTPAEQLRRTLLQLREDRRKAHRSLTTAVHPFSKAFEHTVGSICHEYWQSKAEAWEGVEHSVGLEKANAAIEYFKGDDHRTAGANLALKLRSMAEQVSIYYGQMETFQSNVRRYALELRSRVAENLRYPALSSITPNIHLDLDQVDHWSDIKVFQSHYNRYISNAQHSEALPDIDLVDAFQDVVAHLTDGRGSETGALWQHIRFSFELVENGQHRSVAKEKSLGNCSSNGLAYLVLITLFLGFVETIRKEAPVHLSWSIDELGNFDSANIAALLDTLSAKDLSLVSACPELGYGQHTLFRYRWRVQRRGRQVWLEQLTPDEGEQNLQAKEETPEVTA